MKKFTITALTALVATLSLSSLAEAGWHNNNGWNDDYGYRVVIKKRHHYREDYCYTKKISYYDDYGYLRYKRVKFCD